jgi:hypothetical protein
MAGTLRRAALSEMAAISLWAAWVGAAVRPAVLAAAPASSEIRARPVPAVTPGKLFPSCTSL